MLPIVAEYAADLANRSQVILTTHSAQFLDAFQDKKPVTTVTKSVVGGTALKTVSARELGRWLKQFTLGSLFRSGELEEIA